MRNIIILNWPQAVNKLLAISLLPLFLLQTSCTWEPDLSGIGLPRVHKVDVPQGNVIEQDQINQLRPGMNKQQVLFIMGTPMLDDSFHANRWDYIYRFKPGYGDIEFKQATLYFNEDTKLVNIQGTFRPGDKAEKTHTTTEIVVVPLEDYEGSGSDEEKGYWARFVDFFAWTEEHEGIPSDGDVPVNPRGEGEATQGTMEQSPETQR
ncbi:MAG: outer membrane protein assembly factor BamE [Gammaproteobacteria bacterium]|nr:outer membrane protein assembly factor BamE [Gammaproteobacteria bacterium]